MPSDRSLVVVNYFAAALAREAIRSARASSASPLEVIVVDNSADDGEWSSIDDAGADVTIRAERNLGYAGGINAGAARAHGSVLLVSNPDVVWFEGAVDRLAEAIDRGAAAAGPALVWDGAGEWMLPPPDEMNRSEWIDRTLASRFQSWARARDRRRIARRLRFWTRSSTAEVRALSGAVLAIGREAFDRAGGFDERYALYFEEVDFLRRLRGNGGRIVHVPSARCRHLYNQSASRAPGASEKYLASEIAFHRRWHGERFVRLLHRFGAAAPPLDAPESAGFPIRLPADPAELLVEVAGEPAFDIAGGHFPAGDEVALPRDVLDAYAGATLYLRAIDRRHLEPIASWVVPAGAPDGSDSLQ